MVPFSGSKDSEGYASLLVVCSMVNATMVHTSAVQKLQGFWHQRSEANTFEIIIESQDPVEYLSGCEDTDTG